MYACVKFYSQLLLSRHRTLKSTKRRHTKKRDNKQCIQTYPSQHLADTYEKNPLNTNNDSMYHCTRNAIVHVHNNNEILRLCNETKQV